MPPNLFGHHSIPDCACCHADAAHKPFPNAGDGGVFFLCDECITENWPNAREAFERAAETARALVSANPGDDAYALTLELCEASLDLFRSRNGEQWDEEKLNDAVQRIAAANAAISAIGALHSKEPKGNV